MMIECEYIYKPTIMFSSAPDIHLVREVTIPWPNKYKIIGILAGGAPTISIHFDIESTNTMQKLDVNAGHVKILYDYLIEFSRTSFRQYLGHIKERK